MPSLAHQLRSDRRRRLRRRRVAAGLLIVVATALVGVRILADAGDRRGAEGASPLGGDGVVLGLSAAPTTTADAVRPSERSGLDPGLAAAFDRAQTAAADAGHELTITSGFRTPAEQQELLDAEVEERGSRAEALWWVFPPDRSMHVQGLAVDVGDRGAAAWLVVHGARFGLCHTLSWEWWHFEWRQRWEDARTCPDEARDPAEAPTVDADGTSPTRRHDSTSLAPAGAPPEHLIG